MNPTSEAKAKKGKKVARPRGHGVMRRAVSLTLGLVLASASLPVVRVLPRESEAQDCAVISIFVLFVHFFFIVFE